MKRMGVCLLRSAARESGTAIGTGLFFSVVGFVVGVVQRDKGDVAKALISSLGFALFFFPPALHFGFNVSFWEQIKEKMPHARLWLYSLSSVTAFLVHFYYYWVCDSIDKHSYYSYPIQALMSLVVGAFIGLLYITIVAKESIFYPSSGEQDSP